MKGTQNSKKRTLRLAQIAMLIALIVVLQIIAALLSKAAILPVNITLTLIPLVIGAVMFGPGAGAILGTAFGIIAIILGATGADAFTLTLLQMNPFATVAICLLKGAAAGAAAGAIAIPFNKKDKIYPAVICAAVTAPIVNTGLCVAGLLIFFWDFITGMADQAGQSLLLFVLVGLVGVNFVVEFVINAVLGPAVVRIIEAVKKSKLV